MGIAFKDIVKGKEISFDELSNKILVVDSFNLLYQFLTTIRGRDGTPLTDSQKNITSHLVGLFSRTTKLMQNNIKLGFVFDGIPPDLKRAESQRRAKLKEEADMLYEKAVEEKDIDEMRKYAGRTVRLTKDMIDESKQLIESLGLPVIQAPSEGEAQAAYMVKKGDAFASVSQDYDSLIHGATKLIRNLSIAGKRKKANKLSYDIVKPEIIELNDVLNSLSLDIDQLIALAMLVGTDYNIGGIKGIGPKKGLKLIAQYKKDFDNLFKELRWDDFFDYPWTDVFYTIKKIPTTEDYKLNFKQFDEDKIREILVENHDFADERIDNTLSKLNDSIKQNNQRGLGDFF